MRTKLFIAPYWADGISTIFCLASGTRQMRWRFNDCANPATTNRSPRLPCVLFQHDSCGCIPVGHELDS